MDDRELIRRIQNGQKEYLNTVAEKYYNDIYYFCCYQTGSREDAYDLAQDTFLRFIRYVDQYRYRNLKGYLLTIAMNLCRDFIREMGKAVSPLPEYSVSESGNVSGDISRNIFESVSGCRPEADSACDREYDTRETHLLLEAALRKLPDFQREAVLLHYFYGYKNREIARMTGASYSAVKSRVKQGLEKLKNLLDREDFYG